MPRNQLGQIKVVDEDTPHKAFEFKIDNTEERKENTKTPLSGRKTKNHTTMKIIKTSPVS
jgi:hypothetical protein